MPSRKETTKRVRSKKRSPLAIDVIRPFNPCREAVDWIEAHPGMTFERAWAECPRGDWMLWIAARLGVERKTLVLAACACARLALKFVKPGEERPLRCIETTERWARGEATIVEVCTARAAATAATPAAYAAYAAAYAATPAAYAADAATDAAAYAAYAATYATADATAAAHATAAAAARTSMRIETAAATRVVIPWTTISKYLKEPKPCPSK